MTESLKLPFYDRDSWTPQGASEPVGAGGWPLLRHLEDRDDSVCIEKNCVEPRFEVNGSVYRRCGKCQQAHDKMIRLRRESRRQQFEAGVKPCVMPGCARPRFKSHARCGEHLNEYRRSRYEEIKLANELKTCAVEGCGSRRHGTN